jgi:hypothetical protein
MNFESPAIWRDFLFAPHFLVCTSAVSAPLRDLTLRTLRLCVNKIHTLRSPRLCVKIFQLLIKFNYFRSPAIMVLLKFSYF